MNFKKYLIHNAVKIDKQLQLLLRQWRDEVEKVNQNLVPLVNSFIDSCYGGKKIRGALVVLGYDLTNAKPNKDIYKAAAALEIFQAAILAHDDIIDQSPTRRGKPTLYKQLGGDHYGISQTISLADIGFFLCLRTLSESKFNEKTKAHVLTVFSNMVISTGLGQLLDVELPHSKKPRLKEDVITIHYLKTAYYTIIYPLLLGAMLGGGDKKLLQAIERFGENLGIAFQIQDVILGVYGQVDEIGKSNISDIEESKNTLLISYALEHASPAQKKILDTYYGSKKISQKQAEIIKDIFNQTGALDFSRQEALKYVQIAQEFIPQLTKDIRIQNILSEMAQFLVNRTK